MHDQLSLSLHFYLLYLLLNSCDGNDAFWRHSMLVKQSSSSSRSVSGKQSGWLKNLWTDAGTCVHCTNTCLRHQPLWPATWSNASLTHGQGYNKTSSTKQLVNGESGCVQTWRQNDQGRRHGFESGGGGNLASGASQKKFWTPHFLASGGTKYCLDS